MPSSIGTLENPVVQIAAGHRHTVAVLSDGSVAFWGRNNNGKCTVPSGIGTPENPVSLVATGAFHTVAVLVSQALVDCNENGIEDACELADGSAIDLNLDGVIDACQDTLKFSVPGGFGCSRLPSS